MMMMMIMSLRVFCGWIQGEKGNWEYQMGISSNGNSWAISNSEWHLKICIRIIPKNGKTEKQLRTAKRKYHILFKRLLRIELLSWKCAVILQKKVQCAFLHSEFLTFKFLGRHMTSNPFYFLQTCPTQGQILVLRGFKNLQFVDLWENECKMTTIKLGLEMNIHAK